MSNSFIHWVRNMRDHFGHFLLLFKAPKYNEKVFCIGYNKTGTTSLGKSLEMLGYNNTSFNKRVWRSFYKQGNIDKIINFTAKFDSADDLPWLKEDMIPILDKKFPNSKFIYLDRDEKSWKNSIYNWTYKKTGAYPDMELKLEEFRNHKTFVLDYFKGRSEQDFIRIDIRDPQGFKKVSEFLEKPVLRDDFPHFNNTVKLYGK